eukprot:364707-Chlamydomonas_euryale.AAC.18
MHACGVCMGGHERLPWCETGAVGTCAKHASRPQVEAYHACPGLGRPEAEGVHVNAPRREARGIYMHACPSPAEPAKAKAGMIGQDWRPR